MLRSRRLVVALALLTLGLFVSGCALGPTALRASRMPYNEAIQRTTNEQLLLNLVRLQYRERPLFLEIGSVAAQFSFSESANIDGTINENVPYQAINPDVLGLGARFGYEEKPTITYTPLQGEDFVKRLLAPLQLDTIVLLSHSGWSIDRVLRLTVQGMNGLDNAGRASGPTPTDAPRYEQFARVSGLLRELQQEGTLQLGYESQPTELSEVIDVGLVLPADLLAAAKDGCRFQAVGDEKVVLTGTSQVLVWRIPPAVTETPEAREIVERLRLQPGLATYPVRLTAAGRVDQAVAGDRRTCIDVATRSLMGALFYLSQAVEVPEPHRERGLVTTTVTEDGQPFDWASVTGDLLRVRSSPVPPSNAAVAVRYRGYWFYIDNADLTSKSTFGLLGQLFALQAGGDVRVAPVLTLPVGG